MAARTDACTWKPAGEGDILMKAKTVGILATENEDVRSLRSTLLYGLKGIGAYYTHAAVLGKTDSAVTGFIQKALASMLQDLEVPDMVALVLECGEYGVKVLALLDEANTSAYGKPEITNVKTTVGTRPGILITGHDLKDLEMLWSSQGQRLGYLHPRRDAAGHAYPAFKNTRTYAVITAAHGRTRKEFEQFNGGPLRPTASFPRKIPTRAACSQD